MEPCHWDRGTILSFMLLEICVFFSILLHGADASPRFSSVKKTIAEVVVYILKVLLLRHDDKHFNISGAKP